MSGDIRPQSVLMILLLALILLMISACGARPPAPVSPPPASKGYQVLGKWYYPINAVENFRETGRASWYGDPFHGKKTASGEVYDMHARTAAHKTLPIGTFVRVRNLENSLETIVRINDRGPFVDGRIIDLSYRAAKEIDMIGAGTAPVEIMAIDPKDQSVGIIMSDPDFYTGEFTVQAGAFSDRGSAEAFGRELLGFDNRVTVHPVTAAGRTVYRVRVGRFSSLEQAKALETRLITNGYQQAFAVAGE